MTDRSQSEAVGFVVVFALIVATVSLVTVAGLGELRDVRSSQRVDSVQTSMEVVADDVDELVLGAAPVRETELRLGGGDLAFGDPVSITVSGHETGDPTANFSYDVGARPLVYDAGTGERVVYVAGAVFRQHRTSAVMTNGPPTLVSPDGRTVTIVQTRRGGDTVGIGGASIAQVRAKRSVADLYQVNHTGYDVTVRIASPRAEAWARQLGDRDDTTCSSPGTGVTSCSFTTDRVAVAVVRIDLEVR